MKRFIYLFAFSMIIPMLSGAQIVITEIMYNPPESGIDSLEYIELYNPADVALDLDGYTLTEAVVHEFSTRVIESRGYLVIAVDSAAMENVFDIETVQWSSGALSNGGEAIVLQDPAGDVIDEVEYSPSGDWPAEADGGGSSLELCDPTSDNMDPLNWQASDFDTGLIFNGEELKASPGQDNCEVGADVTIEVRNNIFDPEDITIFSGETVKWENMQGTHNVNGSLDEFPDNPEGFSNGPIAPAPWTHTHTFDEPGFYNYQCDSHTALGMTGTITVRSLSEQYPTYSISEVRGVNGNGTADSLDVLCTLEGVVHSINFQPSGYSFALIDDSGAGITVFEFNPVSDYEVALGDELSIQGRISQFNGLIQFSPDSITVVSIDNSLVEPEEVTDALGEEEESYLIEIRNLELDDPSQWLGDGSNFNVSASNGNGSYEIRVDADSEVSNMEAPDGTFHLTGIGSQFDGEPPFLEGYQVFPRFMEDIEEASAVSGTTLQELELYPNPAEKRIEFRVPVSNEITYHIYDSHGALKLSGTSFGTHSVSVGNLSQGIYFAFFKMGGEQYRATFVKK